eukprot:1157325-Pelagomonas_calceolata.AAC.11
MSCLFSAALNNAMPPGLHPGWLAVTFNALHCAADNHSFMAPHILIGKITVCQGTYMRAQPSHQVTCKVTHIGPYLPGPGWQQTVSPPGRAGCAHPAARAGPPAAHDMLETP